MTQFKNFEISFSKVDGDRRYEAKLNQPLGGALPNASAICDFSTSEFVASQTSLANARKANIIGGAPAYQQVQLRPQPTVEAARTGEELGRLLFVGAIRDAWILSCERVLGPDAQANGGIRLRLNFDNAPELGLLPWEYLSVPGISGLAALNGRLSIIRTVAGTITFGSLQANLPLRILVAVPKPTGLAELDTQKEIDKMAAEFNNVERGDIFVKIVENATFQNVSQELAAAQATGEPFHVFHFIGHGNFDNAQNAGTLVFQKDDGSIQEVTGTVLGNMLVAFKSSLKLAFINSCLGAMNAETDPLSGVAAEIMSTAQIPAAIAMQFEISDKAAIAFAQAFYSTIVENHSIETAVSAGRKAVSTEVPDLAEWATPVLNISSTAAESKLVEFNRPAVRDDFRGHYDWLLRSSKEARVVFFLGLNIHKSLRQNGTAWRYGLDFPATTELCDYLAKTVLGHGQSQRMLPALCEEVRLRLQSVEQQFHPIFESQELNQTAPHEFFGSLAKIAAKVTELIGAKDTALPTHIRPIGPLFVTDGFDSTLERAFEKAEVKRFHILKSDRRRNDCFFVHVIRESGTNVQQVELTESSPANLYVGKFDNSPIILKVPGELSNGEILAAEQDYFSFSDKPINKLLPPEIIARIIESGHVYFGMDLQNWTTRLAWTRLCQLQTDRERYSSRAVIFDVNDNSIPYWHRHGIAHDVIKPSDYLAGLKQLVISNL